MIRVTDLVLNRGTLRILDGASLTVRRGEVAALIGPSGSGKSTLLRCINGLERFQSGEIQVGENRIQSRLPCGSTSLLTLRRSVGMVFQQFHLFPHLHVIDNVSLAPRKALGWERDRADEQSRRLLERVGLGHRLNARPEQLSGGEQQRVAIARALAVQPQAILFDEPTSALDPRMAGEVLAVIADLARDGLTMVIVTHAMNFARQVAETAHVISAGKIVESGPPEQLFSAPSHDTTKSLVLDLMK